MRVSTNLLIEAGAKVQPKDAELQSFLGLLYSKKVCKTKQTDICKQPWRSLR